MSELPSEIKPDRRVDWTLNGKEKTFLRQLFFPIDASA
jgi:hypothetical protein